MLTNNMTLTQMANFKPSDEDMVMLPLDVILYIKVTVISAFKEDNYEFIRFFFNDPDLKDYLKDIDKTIVYDFKASEERIVSIFEIFGNKNYMETVDYLNDLLGLFEGQAEALFSIYTHDNKEYLLSNLDGIVKLEEVNKWTTTKPWLLVL